MSALLAYRNDTSAVMDWVKDFTARSQAVQEARSNFLQKLADDNGVTEKLFTWGREGHASGISWPVDAEPPDGWYRPAGEDPRVIRPHMGRKLGKAAEAELRTLSMPDGRAEMSKRFAMKAWVLIPDTNRYLTPGYRIEDDAVWVTWGSRDVTTQLDGIGEHGWDRVPLVEYIQRFGEDDL